MLKEYFHTLELSETASWNDVQAAYRLLIQVWHPDRFQDDALKLKAEAKMRQLNGAIEILREHFEPAKESHDTNCELSQVELRPFNESNSQSSSRENGPSHSSFKYFAVLVVTMVFLAVVVVQSSNVPKHLPQSELPPRPESLPPPKPLTRTGNSKSAGVFEAWTIPPFPQKEDPFILVVEIDPAKSVIAKNSELTFRSLRVGCTITDKNFLNPLSLGAVYLNENNQAIFKVGSLRGKYGDKEFNISCPELLESRSIAHLLGY